MSKVTLVFDDGRGQLHVECNRVKVAPSEVREGDFLACPHVGFVHVMETRTEGNVVYLTDPHGHEHIYFLSAQLEVARPD